MKLIILVALALAAIAVAAPLEEPIKIIRSEYDQKPEGAYVYGFETENGIHHQQQGEIKEVLDEDKKPHPVVVVRGSYGYTNPDGLPENINYYADETGFHAEGESIPKQPLRR